MHIEHQDGKAVAVCDSLIGKDGKPIKLPVQNQSEIDSAKQASLMGERMAQNFMRMFGQGDTA